ncbi:MAG: hypothetical protein K2X48_17740 [Chitinophagaceae bacterium]|nr:hypothetical protein [Chitinophagaceae bacterium]
MAQIFTPEDLVQYLYKETSPEQNAAIEQAMEQDWTLREKFEVIKKAHARLEQFKISPRIETILSVLKYGNSNVVTEK